MFNTEKKFWFNSFLTLTFLEVNVTSDVILIANSDLISIPKIIILEILSGTGQYKKLFQLY
jgi:hypothetical protein